jgi:hypothetical protein
VLDEGRIVEQAATPAAAHSASARSAGAAERGDRFMAFTLTADAPV